ncbi:transposase [Streptomyces sp. NPDC055085]
MTRVRNRGVRDVLTLVCDSLITSPEVVGAIWSRTVLQTCVVHHGGGSEVFSAK